MSAIISDDGLYRYRLERDVQLAGIVFGYFGINGSTAGVDTDDQTVRKWNGFTLRNGGRRYITGNAFGYRTPDVGVLATVPDPVGPENRDHLRAIIADADVLVPCWGSRSKIPPRLQHHLLDLRDLLFASGKPVKVFGFTKGGDPKHPLMLGYDTQLVPWERA